MRSVDAEQAAQSLAPTGRLRAAINFGNRVLAQRDPSGGAAHDGVSIRLARELARQLGAPLELVLFDAAGKVFAALAEGGWDIAFLANEPERAKDLAFSPAYVTIEGTYLVAEAAPYRSVEDVDHPGAVIAVGRGAAYDLHLSRALHHARLERAATSDAAVEAFLGGIERGDGLTAAAGVRQALEEFARSRSGVRVLPDAFARLEQAMATPIARVEGAAYLSSFIQDAKATGFVRRSLDETGQADACVAAT